MTTDEFIDSIIPSQWEYSYSDLVRVVEAEREAILQIIKETPYSNWYQGDIIEAIRARGGNANTM